MPAISVLLPVRDAEPWLSASLASLFRQTRRDFEIVAVDDGSRDGSGELLERAARGDGRLRVLHTAARGLPLALDAALGHARGRWIARHDADDLSHRRRFERQAEFLAQHGDIDVVGTRLRLFPLAKTGAGMRRWGAWHNRLLTHAAIAAEALIDSPLAHGTAMIRREALERAGGWTERGFPEDHDLWLRMLASGARFAKLPEALYGWRQHGSNATRRDPRYERSRFVALKCEALARGFLRGVRTVRLAGTGESLDRWTRALRDRGFAVEVCEAARPSAATVQGLARPALLVFMAPVARERWRRQLRTYGMREMHDFMFTA